MNKGEFVDSEIDETVYEQEEAEQELEQEELEDDLEQEEESADDAEQEDTEGKVKPEAQDNTYIDYDKIENEEVRKTVKARIDKEWREKKKQERELADLKARLREHEEKLNEYSKPVATQMPTQDDWYEDPVGAQNKMDAYIKSQGAVSQWEAAKAQREQQYQAELKEVEQRRTTALLERAEKAGIPQRDFIDSCQKLGATNLNMDLQNYLIDHDKGAELINYLAKNPIEAEELASLSPFAAGDRLNKLVAKVGKKPVRKSKAPAPDTPAKGKATVIDRPWINGKFS